jgi:hypothetical protein
VAIAHKARRPRADYPPMRIVHFSGETLSYGVEDKKLEGLNVRVFDPAKTVADCFKYRNKIGLEVALEPINDLLGFLDTFRLTDSWPVFVKIECFNGHASYCSTFSDRYRSGTFAGPA